MAELEFLRNYDRAKPDLLEIVDMPDNLVDLFIRLCLENKGRLSLKKRRSHFQFLSDEDLAELEAAVRKGFAVD